MAKQTVPLDADGIILNNLKEHWYLQQPDEIPENYAEEKKPILKYIFIWILLYDIS